MSDATLPADVRTITEAPVQGGLPHVRHPEWAHRHPWLVQGTTRRGGGAHTFDLALFGPGPGTGGRALAHWDQLLVHTGCVAAAHARQVHGASVRVHRELAPGLHLAPPCDGHLTRRPGVLLAVTVADCVPVTLVHPEERIVGSLHAGWRGAAAGILETGLATLKRAWGVDAAGVEVHLGPAICGSCYEVGPEVHTALDLPAPSAPTPVDLRAVLAHRCLAAGVPGRAVTVSTHCTRCGDGEGGGAFFSHRAGDGERQVGFVGLRWA
jgi:hypothetical protein